MLSDILSNILKRKPASPVATDDAMDIGITPKPLESPIADAGQLPLPADNPQASVNAAPVVPTFINQGNWRAARAPEKNVQSEFNAHMANPNTPTDWSRSEDPYAKDRYDAVTNGGTALPHRSWKDALKNIAAGALQGAATGAAYGNPLGGLLGGAAAGGIGGTISPVAGAESRFNAFQLPKLLQNRQLAQEQALNSAKVNAENQKAAQEAATAQQRGLIKTDNGLYDARRGAIIPSTAPNKGLNIKVVPNMGVALDENGNKVFENTQPKSTAPPAPHWVMDANGNYVDLNKATTPVKGYTKETDTGLTPLEKIRLQREDEKQAQADYANVEDLKRQAIEASKSDKAEVRAQASALLGQHAEAARQLAQQWPGRFDVKFDKSGQWAEIHQRSASRPDVNSAPVKGQGRKAQSSGRTISGQTAMDLLNR